MVYFVQDSVQGFIKIGRTHIPMATRISALQTGNPNVLICLRVIESEDNDSLYHVEFGAHRYRGEWFRPAPELLAFIARLPATASDGVRAPWSDGGNQSTQMRKLWAAKRVKSIRREIAS